MATAAPTLAPPLPPAVAVRMSPSAVAAAVIAIAVAARIVAGAGTPLWFDETFSAVIASQPSAAAMVDWCRAEIGGPVYYMLLWGWAQAFGTSAVALRSLSFVASVAAPALIAWRGHPDRATRLTWAALLALWLPGVDAATNARCYALAVFFTTAQAITFRRMMTSPTIGCAFAWTSASVMAILTHSYCAALALVGGTVLLAVHRGRALRCWPALAPLVPMTMWLAYQLPTLVKYSAQGAWYQRLNVLDLALAPSSFFESPALGLIITVGPLMTLAKGWRGDHSRADRALAITGLVAFAIVLAAATLKPSFTWRYAIPFGPAILFAVTIWILGVRSRFAVGPALLIALFGASTIGRVVALVAHRGEDYRTKFNLVLPSNWLAANGARHLAFLWDSPAMGDPQRTEEAAGYFLRQRGPVALTVLKATSQQAPAALVAGTIRRDPTIDSLIWLADRAVPGTRAMPDRRMMARLGWTCRDYARDPIVMLTCHAPDR